jgi:hypothetical protein
MQHLMGKVREYSACVKLYVESRQAAATCHGQKMRKEAEAGNVAVTQINEFFTRLKAFEEKHGKKE